MISIQRELCDSDVEIFIKKCHSLTNRKITGYRRSFLKSKIEGLMQKQKEPSFRQFISSLSSTSINHFLDSLTVPTTAFFRDYSMYDELHHNILPTIKSQKKQNNSKVLRVWSAGCSTGEEAYSLAILFHEVFQEDIKNLIYSITASDVNHNSLEHAKKGTYHHNKTSKIPSHIITNHFQDHSHKDKHHEVKNHLKHNVRFQKMDLNKDEFAKHFDLILFRNVSIYLSREKQEQILHKFHESLNHNGFLVIGKTETMPNALLTKFKLVNLDERIFQKI